MAEIANRPLLICDGERIVVVNNPMRSLLPPHRPPEGRMLGHVLPGWTVDRIPHGVEIDATIAAADGRPLAVRLSKRTILHRDRPHAVVTVSDQRHRLEQEAELRRLQDTDALTGLANRPAFQAAVAESLATDASGTAGPGSARFALLVVGLDRFAAVNASFGHAAGDDLLRRTAARLQSLQTGALIVGRLGSDQFGLFLEEVDPAQVQVLGTTLIEVLTLWLRTDSQTQNVGVSAGFAMAPSDAADGDALSMAADLALRRAKEAGRGACRRYETGLAEEERKRHHTQAMLRRAVAERQFEVHFQPQADLRTGAFDGAEALLRWRHPDRGFVEPGEFLPIAEEIGLIEELGEWVLQTACAAAAGWPGHLRVAVNLSAVQFRTPDLAERFGRILADAGLAPGRLELEVTESILIEDDDRTLTTMTELRAMGIRMALDDFGTGYSSLGYLRRFPFDKIKLDKSFIDHAPEDAGKTAIVTTILALGRSLGMTTTAEGVETEQQYAFVTAQGCTQVQGFLIARPVPNSALPEAFRRLSGPVPAV